MSGKINIDTNYVYFGMIKMGDYRVSLYPDSGIVWENQGQVIFKGRCYIGNASVISTGKTGNIVFGDNFVSTACLKLCSYHHIEFHSNVLVGWENIFMDTDFHKVTRLDGKNVKSYAPIIIGKNNWFGFRCVITKDTQTPDYTIIGTNSLLNKKYEISPYTLIAGNPPEVKVQGVYRNLEDDIIEYE